MKKLKTEYGLVIKSLKTGEQTHETTFTESKEQAEKEFRSYLTSCKEYEERNTRAFIMRFTTYIEELVINEGGFHPYRKLCLACSRETGYVQGNRDEFICIVCSAKLEKEKRRWPKGEPFRKNDTLRYMRIKPIQMV